MTQWSYEIESWLDKDIGTVVEADQLGKAKRIDDAVGSLC